MRTFLALMAICHIGSSWAVRVAVELAWMPELWKPDRAVSSLLLSILVLQRKFKAEVDIKIKQNVDDTGVYLTVGCDKVDCLQEATKKFIGEGLIEKGLKVEKDEEGHDFSKTGKKYDVYMRMGESAVPETRGFGSTLNMYFLSYEHHEKRHPGLRFFQPSELDNLGDLSRSLATYDCVFIPSPVVHDVFVMGTSSIFNTCREEGLMCPTVMTNNIAGHMYQGSGHGHAHGHGHGKGKHHAGEAKDIRQSASLKEKLVEGLTTIVWRYMQQAPFRDKVRSMYPIYRKYPISSLANGVAGTPSKYTALIVEPTLNAYFEFAVRTVVRQLSVNSKHKWTLKVMHSDANERYVKDCLKDLQGAGKVVFEKIPVSVHVVAEYNQMTKHASFWEPYKAAGSKVLLFQSDTVLLGNSTSIDDFMLVDYIGAPWHDQYNDRLNELRAAPGKFFQAGVGNGGLSLRSGDVMYYIATKSGDSSPHTEQEDLFYVKQIELEQRGEVGTSPDSEAHEGSDEKRKEKELRTYAAGRPSSFVVADRELAWKFAYEVKCEDQAGKMNPDSSGWKPPLGLHAAWYYWTYAEMNKFLSYL